MSQNNAFVGKKIKTIREGKDITVEQLAERSGLAVEQIRSIEEDEKLPSLAPLTKIARALGVRLGTFLDDNTEIGPVVCRKGEKSGSLSFSNDMVGARKHMEYFIPARLFIHACRFHQVHFPFCVVPLKGHRLFWRGVP